MKSKEKLIDDSDKPITVTFVYWKKVETTKGKLEEVKKEAEQNKWYKWCWVNDRN